MRRLATTALLILWATVAAAQAPATEPPPAPPPTEGEPASADETMQQTLEDILLEQPASGDTYRYDPQGRRDPFRSLVGPKNMERGKDRPQGVPGFLIDELDLQGVFRTRQGLVAMIKGPDNKGYMVRGGQKLYDGEITEITPVSIVFRQEVNDPTQIARFKTVVKELSQAKKR